LPQSRIAGKLWIVERNKGLIFAITSSLHPPAHILPGKTRIPRGLPQLSLEYFEIYAASDPDIKIVDNYP